MRHVDLALSARWIVPIEPHGVLEEHVVLVDAGRIVAVAHRDDAAREYLPREELDLPQHVLLPGLVNAHTHTAMALMRGIADDVPLASWLSDHIWPRESRFVSPEFVHDGVMLGAVRAAGLGRLAADQAGAVAALPERIAALAPAG